MRKGEFAEALGVTKARVSQHISKGMPVEPNGWVHFERAKDWIERNSARRLQRLDPEQRQRLASKGAIEAHRAELLELDVAQRRGTLVNKKLAEDALFRWARAERDSWLAWTARMAPTIAGELAADQAAVFRVLDRQVRAHLADLAEKPLEPLADV